MCTKSRAENRHTFAVIIEASFPLWESFDGWRPLLHWSQSHPPFSLRLRPCQMNEVPGQLSSLSSLSFSLSLFLTSFVLLSGRLSVFYFLSSTHFYLSGCRDATAHSFHISMIYGCSEKGTAFCPSAEYVMATASFLWLYSLAFGPILSFFSSKATRWWELLFSGVVRRWTCVWLHIILILPAMWAHRPCHAQSNCSERADSWHLWWHTISIPVADLFGVFRQIDFCSEALIWADLSVHRAERKDRAWVDQTDRHWLCLMLACHKHGCTDQPESHLMFVCMCRESLLS